MNNGYPRFFIHKSIQALAASITEKYGTSDQEAILFPSRKVSSRCVGFFRRQAAVSEDDHLQILDFELIPQAMPSDELIVPKNLLSAVLYPKKHAGIAKVFWQHAGDGISSRRAEFCHKALDGGLIREKSTTEDSPGKTPRLTKGPRRYQRNSSIDASKLPAVALPDGANDSKSKGEGLEYSQFVEERFGRNLNSKLAANAKLAIRRRIAGSLMADVDLPDALDLHSGRESARQVKGFSDDDVYLYPTGMSAIFNSHRTMLAARGEMKSIMFG